MNLDFPFYSLCPNVPLLYLIHNAIFAIVPTTLNIFIVNRVNHFGFWVNVFWDFFINFQGVGYTNYFKCFLINFNTEEHSWRLVSS